MHIRINPFFKNKKGKFGKVTNHKYLSDIHYDGKKAILQYASRFENNGNIIAEMNIDKCLDETKKFVSLKPYIIVPNIESDKLRYYSIYMSFLCSLSHLKEYYYQFEGNIGWYNHYFHISKDTYEKVENKIIEICNPNNEYNINEFIDLLKDCEESEIQEILTHWNEVIELENSNQKRK